MSRSILHTTGDSWKSLAKTYPTKHSLGAQTLLARLNEISPIRNAKGIFDIGCGTGVITELVLGDYSDSLKGDVRLLAGDFSEGMLNVLRETKAKKTTEVVGKGSEAWAKLEIRNIDAHNLEGIADGSFSHVIGCMVYFLLPDPLKALRETHRVLCADGVVATMNGKTMQHIDAIGEAVEEIRPGTYLKLLSGSWTNEEGVKGEFGAAGFGDVETMVVEGKMEYETHEGLADLLLKMPVMGNVVEGWQEGEKERLREVLIEKLKAKNGEAPGSLKGLSIIAFARKSGGGM